ncbi:MAG: hypothetical protein ACRD4S_02685 [Candidatus Acidiferrales bacterium]
MTRASSHLPRYARILLVLAILIAAAVPALWWAFAPPSYESGSPACAATPKSENIVVGFVGGYVGRNNTRHAEVQLADRLRREYPSGIVIATFNNHYYSRARNFILCTLHTENEDAMNGPDRLPNEKRHSARIILYGHSWGAAAAILLARELQHDGVPVALTVQVDSVSKWWRNDGVIPPNVAKAVNFYQRHGALHGRAEIAAADPTRTVIQNFEFDYERHPVRCPGYPWWDLLFAEPHTEIECDPKVWNDINALIRDQLPLPARKPPRDFE